MSNNNLEEIKDYLDEQYLKYCHSSFITDDPVQIPHLFDSKQNKEIAGFFAATFAWGQRKTIIAKSKDLIARMDNNPHDFICNFQDADLRHILGFRHRTFSGDNAVAFIRALAVIYRNYASMDDYLLSQKVNDPINAARAIRKIFEETGCRANGALRHVADVESCSAAKRLNMFFRWMVRTCHENIDFGIWSSIKPQKLLIPLDVHVGSVSRGLGLLSRNQNDLKAVLELTQVLRTFDPDDPIRYDFALFSIGVHTGRR